MKWRLGLWCLAAALVWGGCSNALELDLILEDDLNNDVNNDTNNDENNEPNNDTNNDGNNDTNNDANNDTAPQLNRVDGGSFNADTVRTAFVGHVAIPFDGESVLTLGGLGNDGMLVASEGVINTGSGMGTNGSGSFLLSNGDGVRLLDDEGFLVAGNEVIAFDGQNNSFVSVNDGGGWFPLLRLNAFYGEMKVLNLDRDRTLIVGNSGLALHEGPISLDDEDPGTITEALDLFESPTNGVNAWLASVNPPIIEIFDTSRILRVQLEAGADLFGNINITPSMGLPPARSFPGVVQNDDGQVLIVGGYDNMSGGVNASYLTHDSSDGTPLNRNGALPEFITPVYGTKGVLVGNFAVFFGGATELDAEPCRHATNQVFLYNFATGEWSLGPEMSVPRVEHTVTVLPNDTIVVVGGEADGSAVGCEANRSWDVYQFAPAQSE